MRSEDQNNNNGRSSIQNRITQGVIWKQLLLFFFPLLFGSFFQQLYNTADALIVGRFVGKEALAAVGGSAAILTHFFIGFFNGLSAGAAVVIAQFFGGGSKKRLSEALHTSILLAAAGGAVFMAAGLIGAPYALKAMGTPADTLADSILYIRIFFCGMIANLVYNMGAGIIRAMGDSRRPLYILIISCIINILLDIFLVVVLRLGVAGVAIATVICQVLSAAMVLFLLCRLDEEYALRPDRLKISGPMLKRILAIGLPTGIQATMYSFSNIIIQSSINSFDTDAVSAWAAVGKIDAIYWMVINSLGVSITTFVGQNYGAGLTGRARSSVRQGFVISGLSTAFISAMLYLFSLPLVRIFTDDAEVISMGSYMMRYLVTFYITYFMIEVFNGALRGMGNSFVPMMITVAGVCVLRMIWLFTVLPRNHTVLTVMRSYPISWITTSLLLFLYYMIYIHHLHPLHPRRRRDPA